MCFQFVECVTFLLLDWQRMILVAIRHIIVTLTTLVLNTLFFTAILVVKTVIYDKLNELIKAEGVNVLLTLFGEFQLVSFTFSETHDFENFVEFSLDIGVF